MAKYAEITGWGKCMPPAVMTNDDFASVIDTSDEWIRTRSGIAERRVSHVPNSDLAAVAAMRAMAAAGVVGVLLPMTGEASTYGESMKNGIDLALEMEQDNLTSGFQAWPSSPRRRRLGGRRSSPPVAAVARCGSRGVHR